MCCASCNVSISLDALQVGGCLCEENLRGDQEHDGITWCVFRKVVQDDEVIKGFVFLHASTSTSAS